MTTIDSLREKDIPHVAILRALPGLGDFLCAIPAIRALRMALPRARVSLIGLASIAPLAHRYPHYVDDWLDLPGFPGLPERPFDARAFAAFLSTVQQSPLDLAIQMHGSGHLVNILTELLGARFTAGYYPPGSDCPNPERFLPYPDAKPEIYRNLHLVEFLGAPARGADLEFPVTGEDRAALAAIAVARALVPHQYVCIHPGAKNPARRWPPDHFAAVARALEERGLQVVLTGGPAETELARAIIDCLSDHAVNLTGQTSLGALAALVENATCVICNDTGISHLAVALDVPAVVIFHGGPTARSDPPRWAPLDLQRHRVAAPLMAPLAGGQLVAAPSGVTSIDARPWVPVTTAHVLALVDDVLQKEAAHAA